MEEMIKTLLIYAGRSEIGIPVFEEVDVKEIGQKKYKLISAPGLALNLAKEDVFKQISLDKPVEVIKRGGNFNVHIYKCNLNLEDYEDFKGELYNYINGTIDGIKEDNLAITIPSTESLDKISNFFSNFENISKNNWSITNIYKNYEDFNDDTLLDWWENL